MHSGVFLVTYKKSQGYVHDSFYFELLGGLFILAGAAAGPVFMFVVNSAVHGATPFSALLCSLTLPGNAFEANKRLPQ